jgi:2-phospho-L-lactate guanylyltransferase
MRNLTGAKTRLGEALHEGDRAELALAMFTDVVTVCLDSGLFTEVRVVSGDSEVHWHARELGAKPLAEPATLSGLNDSLTFGQRYLARRVAVSELLILPADVPLVSAEDVRRVMESLGETAARAVLVRARDGGTNALAMRPPEALPMRFGAGSADRHAEAAREATVELVELENEHLRFDVDSPEDVEALATLPVGAATAVWLGARAHYARGGR